ncbi:HNHc domain-containing protein [Mycena indigotica]|uniref:HNHc domain-containing protein n=1 Tax=Mycena indigotica TaxID=2126181 RepID=A0A8H6SGG7_9AGAR|nr:HNHc domain-containing protein [Mycena indigotica]KAF7299150.1 HNHc domain-containing protein [Mycena indigotica]
MDAEELARAAKEVVFDARRKDELHKLTPRLIRQRLETQFGLAEGTLEGSEYKKALKAVIGEATSAPIPPLSKPVSESKKRKTPDGDDAEAEEVKKDKEPAKPRKRPSTSKKVVESDGDSDESDAPKPRKRQKTTKKPAVASDDSDEEKPNNKSKSKPKPKEPKSRSSAKSAPKKAFKSSETVLSSDAEPTPDDDDNDKMEGSSKPTEKPKASATAATADKSLAAHQSDSELSVLEDDPPKKSNKRTTEKKKEKTTGSSDDKHDAQIKKLKSFVSACGVRKVWSKVFADIDKPTRQIQKLKEILAELGMEGQPSLAKAKAIKQRRELAQELEDVQNFAASRGMKAKAGDKKKEQTQDTSEDEAVPEKRKPNARQSIMAFLEDQSSDGDD